MVSDSLALSEFRLGPLRLPNRIAFAATVNNLGKNSEITAEQVAFYEERARGGTGLIITEGLSVHPTSIPNSTIPLAYDATLISGFARLAEAVHHHDRPVLGQLWHVGRQALWNPSLIPWSPSGERDPYSGSTPHVMTEEEIREVIAGFTQSAAHLAQAGFAGVELHGAHGYLLTQFLSPWSNHRSDAWGGSVANRSRIVVDIVQAIRERCGNDFIVGLKLTGHEYVDGGLDLEASQAIVDHILSRVELDYIAVSPANFSPSLEYHLPDLRFADVPFEYLARGIRQVAAGRSPVMAVGKIPDLKVASRLIADGSADLAAMSRPLLADPALIIKAMRGRRPRPCIYCNVCWHAIHTGRPISCIYGPETGQEKNISEHAPSYRPEFVRPLNVQVVGAGPAGLEFARVAGLDGHRVEVYEASDRVGGRLAWEAEIPGRELYQKAVDWLEDEVAAIGGVIHRRRPIELGYLSSLDGDVRVLAVGAEPVVEPLPELATVVSLEQALANPAALDDPVWIVDEIEAEPVYAAAEHIANAGNDVRIVTRRESIGRNLAFVSRIGALRRLDEAGIRITTLMVPLHAEDGVLTAFHVFSRREHRLGRVGTVVRAGPYRSRLPVIDESRTLIIGDASAPREVLAVVREANAAARSLASAACG
jgi:dimethylglycine catabolism A